MTGLRIELPTVAPLHIVAVGGESKNTVCVVRGNQATVTDALGDPSDVNSYRRFVQTIDDMQRSLAGGDFCLAVSGRVICTYMSGVSIDGEPVCPGARMAKVDFQGSSIEASLMFTPEARVGDWILVHAGFGIRVLDKADALETWKCLAPIMAGSTKEVGRADGDRSAGSSQGVDPARKPGGA